MRFKLLLSIGVIFLLSSVIALAALDLRFITAISQAPDPASAGTTVTFTVSFKTFGGSVDNLKIIGGVDGGASIFERTYAHIDSDVQRTETFTWTAIEGLHSAWFKLDPTCTTSDSDFTNNMAEKLFEVWEAPQTKPDLILVVTYSPTKFIAGDSVKFLIRVVNHGTVTANPSKLHIKYGESLIADINVFPLKSGASTEITHFWNAKCDETITIIADAMNQNKESNENNNTWSQKMVCSPKRPINTKYEHYKKLH